jgi:carbamoyltransferase
MLGILVFFAGECNVMTLGPHGEARFAQTILDHLIGVKPDGTFRLDQRHFDYCTWLRMTTSRSRRCSAGRPAAPTNG